MEQPIVLKNKLVELKMLQYDMVLCIRRAFEFEESDFLPVNVQINCFGRGSIVVRPDVLTRSLVIQNTITGDEEVVNYTATPETLPVLQNRILTHLAALDLPNIQW